MNAKLSFLIKVGLMAVTLCATGHGPARAAQDVTSLQAISVTAQKLEQNEQDVAVPMSVITEAEIADLNIRSFSDLSYTMPNLQFLSSGRPGGGYFNFRGLGMFGMSVISERSPVVIYYDGIAWDGRFALGADFGNVERIEFLRGPQGVIYGKNAMGGVLNVITRDVGNEVAGEVSAYLEERNAYKAGFWVQGPVVDDKLALYASGSFDATDGWITDHTPGGEEHWDGQKNQHVFLKGVATPCDAFKATVQYSFDNTHAHNAPFIVGRDITHDVTTGFHDPYFKTDSHNAALKMDLAMSPFDLTAISTLRDTHTKSHQYFGLPTSAGFDDIQERVFTQEIRLASAKRDSRPDAFSWLVGGFFSVENLKRDTTGYYYDLSAYGQGTVNYDYPTNFDTNTYALFGEITVPLFFKGLSMALGVRYENVNTTMDHRYEETSRETGAYYADPIAYTVDDAWDNLLGKIAMQYQLSEDVMLYGSIAQGYTPGGFNYLENDKNYAAFDEQKSIDYELGFKSMLFSRRLMLNPNIFYSEYKDLQVSQEVESMHFIVTNAGKAHALGLELDYNWLVFKGLNVHGGVGVIQAVYDEFKENVGAGVVDYSDKNMPNTPEFTANIAISYRHQCGFVGTADFRQIGATYLSKDNSDHFKRDSFSLLGGKIGWEFASGLSAYAYVRNLLDEDYFTEASEEYNIFMVGEPRTFGVQLSYGF